jgi:hypothetical protein
MAHRSKSSSWTRTGGNGTPTSCRLARVGAPACASGCTNAALGGLVGSVIATAASHVGAQRMGLPCLFDSIRNSN